MGDEPARQGSGHRHLGADATGICGRRGARSMSRAPRFDPDVLDAEAVANASEL